jgi:hypothetical protein
VLVGFCRRFFLGSGNGMFWENGLSHGSPFGGVTEIWKEIPSGNSLGGSEKRSSLGRAASRKLSLGGGARRSSLEGRSWEIP